MTRTTIHSAIALLSANTAWAAGSDGDGNPSPGRLGACCPASDEAGFAVADADGDSGPDAADFSATLRARIADRRGSRPH